MKVSFDFVFRIGREDKMIVNLVAYGLDIGPRLEKGWLIPP